ncbi:hypothetical protein [Chryseobacterium kimseyorum]|nr:hypothetical protein [Chryseobacterium kimseyorum]
MKNYILSNFIVGDNNSMIDKLIGENIMDVNFIEIKFKENFAF